VSPSPIPPPPIRIPLPSAVSKFSQLAPEADLFPGDLRVPLFSSGSDSTLKGALLEPENLPRRGSGGSGGARGAPPAGRRCN